MHLTATALAPYIPFRPLGRPRRDVMTLTEAMVMLGRQMEAEGCSPETVTAYQGDVRAFVSYLNTVKAKDTIGHFTRQHIQGWQVDQHQKGIHANTRNRRLASLGKLAKFLLRLEKLDRDPLAGIERSKRPERIPRYLPAEIATRLIRAAGPTVLSRIGSDQKIHQTTVYQHRNEAILRVMLQGGLRLSEVESLSLMRLRPDGFIVLGKGNKEGHVSMPPSAMKAVEAWLEERRGGPGPEEALFTNHEGGHLSKKQIYRVVKDTAQRLGLAGVYPHLLRHTMASLLLERGEDLRNIQKRLRHQTIATTELYTKAVPVDQVAVAAKLEDL